MSVAASVQPFRAWSVVGHSVQLLLRGATIFGLLTLAASGLRLALHTASIAIWNLVQTVSDQTPAAYAFTMPWMLLQIAIHLCLFAAVVFAAGALWDKQGPTLDRCLRSAVQGLRAGWVYVLAPLVLLVLPVWLSRHLALGKDVDAIVTLVGMGATLVAQVWVWVMLPAVLQEGGGVFRAFRRSHDLLRGSRIRVLGLVVIMDLLVSGYLFGAINIFRYSLELTLIGIWPTPVAWGLSMLLAVLYGLLTMAATTFAGIVVATTYRHLVGSRPVGQADIAEIFD